MAYLAFSTRFTDAATAQPEPACAAFATFAEAPAPHDADALEERAAIIEHDAMLPVEWAEAFARLLTADPRGDISRWRWERLQRDAERFLVAHAATAIRLGWPIADIFGIHPRAPETRYDCAGLLWVMDSRELAFLEESRAGIRTRAEELGGKLIYFSRPMNDADAARTVERVMLWDMPRAPL
jgi:hypothetical protein